MKSLFLLSVVAIGVDILMHIHQQTRDFYQNWRDIHQHTRDIYQLSRDMVRWWEWGGGGEVVMVRGWGWWWSDGEVVMVRCYFIKCPNLPLVLNSVLRSQITVCLQAQHGYLLKATSWKIETEVITCMLAYWWVGRNVGQNKMLAEMVL